MKNSHDIKTLVLSASLKHGPEKSNTEEVSDLVISEMKKLAKVTSETIRLADKNIPVGLSYDEGLNDEWPGIAEKILSADVIIFATPIWWGQRSSLMQRIIERMDSFDEGEVEGGREVLKNKVAGVVITGSEDGAQQVLASLLEFLTFMNFTLPPQCCTYWVGEVGMDPKTDAQRRRKNKAVSHMAQATAQGLIHYAQILKKHSMPKNKS